MADKKIYELDLLTVGVALTFFEASLNGAGSYKIAHNFVATAAPTVNDDLDVGGTGYGYSKGSLWFDLTNKHVWWCQSAAAGAAAWFNLSEVISSVFRVTDSADLTKKLAFGLTAITTGTTRTLTMPDSDVDLTDLASKLSAASAPGTDNILVKTDGTGRAMQATGISVDDSNNVTGLGTLNSQRIPDGAGGTTESTTSRSASSTDDNRVIECSHASGCTVSVNAGTTAGIIRAYFASGTGMQVTVQKGTLTTLHVGSTYDQGSSSFITEETKAVAGVLYLSTSVGIAMGRMAAA